MHDHNDPELQMTFSRPVGADNSRRRRTVAALSASSISHLFSFATCALTAPEDLKPWLAHSPRVLLLRPSWFSGRFLGKETANRCQGNVGLLPNPRVALFLDVPLQVVGAHFLYVILSNIPSESAYSSTKSTTARDTYVGFAYRQCSRRYLRRCQLWMSLLLPWVTTRGRLLSSLLGTAKWGPSTKTLVISLSRDVLQHRSAPPFYPDHFCFHHTNRRKLWRSCKRGSLLPIDPWGR